MSSDAPDDTRARSPQTPRDQFFGARSLWATCAAEQDSAPAIRPSATLDARWTDLEGCLRMTGLAFGAASRSSIWRMRCALPTGDALGPQR